MDECPPEYMTLYSEFAIWQIRNPGKIRCSGESLTEDGRLVMNLSIGDTKFNLLCPPNYPDYEDSFFMETECTDFWCIALNEFIIDSPEKLTIDTILAKACLYYTPSSKKSSESSDNESENENEWENDREQADSYQCSIDDLETTEAAAEWECIISKKKRDWRAKEGELRLKYNRPKISDMFDGKIMDHPQQVFSNSAASAILINDLINIMRGRNSSGIIVDPVENDICKWSVILKGFDPASKMSEDLAEIRELYGYDHVQLQLDFAMDLYPLQPPLIRVLRPKLLGVFDGKEIIKLANWSPARDMTSVLKEVKNYISAKASVDMNNKWNGVKVGVIEQILGELADILDVDHKPTSNKTTFYSTSQATAIEMILTNLLNYLKNVGENSQPNCVVTNICSTDSYFTFNLAPNNIFFCDKNLAVQSEASTPPPPIFKAFNRLLGNQKSGTRNHCAHYGKMDLPDGKSYCNIITNPSFELSSPSQNEAELEYEKYSVNNIRLNELVKKNTSSGSQDKNSVDILQANVTSNATVVSSFNSYAQNFEELSRSIDPAVQVLNANMTCIHKILKESVLPMFIRSNLAISGFFDIWQITSQFSKIIQIIIELASNPYLIDLLTTSEGQDQSIAEILKIQKENVTLILENLTHIADGCPMNQVNLGKVKLARDIIVASKLIESMTTKHCDTHHSDRTSSALIDSTLVRSSRQHVVEYDDSVYKDSLKELQFSNFDIAVETHDFKNDFIADIDSPRDYFRIAQEIAELSKFLPLESSSAIFVRTDHSKSSLMQALITGAEGTFYSGGCFSFDIYLPKDYPSCGPKISCTTFRGGKRIWYSDNATTSPLLFGLNTEPWTGIPSILQVLTFIQKEKLPYLFGQNEINMDLEDRSGIRDEILTNVIQFTMINQIREPICGFEDVISTHFRMKKDQILSELEKYKCLRNSEILGSLKDVFDNLSAAV
ncbi:uncharacterized protein LOC105684383 [Athalia rosae]|uniref:uncharacterized protein LOC105684383 n=1 Tax=Athalia rosae TaxID=37344 RepID=UPI0020339C26|nr:uncharacterized protein LOC105684383 [Athalia rosae]XP_048510200.1 uncharacterized protein LOC105684383 [Athalia rosae]